tara:strand:+ start:16886 stop:17203 length:318 start_codon:yes stop_codon:yes gene_type:complete
MEAQWIEACQLEDIDPEDAITFKHEGRYFALYRTDDDRYFATDGLCTHERVPLANGLVMGTIIECPKHQGRFDFITGHAKGAPVCVNLKTYQTQIRGEHLFIKLA